MWTNNCGEKASCSIAEITVATGVVLQTSNKRTPDGTKSAGESGTFEFLDKLIDIFKEQWIELTNFVRGSPQSMISGLILVPESDQTHDFSHFSAAAPTNHQTCFQIGSIWVFF